MMLQWCLSSVFHTTAGKQASKKVGVVCITSIYIYIYKEWGKEAECIHWCFSASMAAFRIQSVYCSSWKLQAPGGTVDFIASVFWIFLVTYFKTNSFFNPFHCSMSAVIQNSRYRWGGKLMWQWNFFTKWAALIVLLASAAVWLFRPGRSSF